MRKKVIAGNWKMNKTASEAKAFFDELLSDINVTDKEVVICPTFTSLSAAVEKCSGSHVGIGAQNVHYEKSGAYTGEVTCEMLTELGVKYVIIGHSERRMYFAETNGSVNKKVSAALNAGLTPIMCIGESLAERERGEMERVVGSEITEGLSGIEPTDKLIIAYEPIWAIGTGVTATDEQAQEACAFIRATIRGIWGDTADKVRILYGGSVKPANIKTLMASNDIDGALVGGASLKADFAQLVNYDK